MPRRFGVVLQSPCQAAQRRDCKRVVPKTNNRAVFCSYMIEALGPHPFICVISKDWYGTPAESVPAYKKDAKVGVTYHNTSK